jgi:hypothetical protein
MGVNRQFRAVQKVLILPAFLETALKWRRGSTGPVVNPDKA